MQTQTIQKSKLPEGWKVKKLIEITDPINSGVKPFKGKKRYIATGDIFDTKIVSFKEVNYENRPSRANMEAKEGDVIFAKMKDTFKVLIIDKDKSNNLYSTGFFVFRPNQNIIVPKWLFYYFRTDYFIDLKNLFATGSTQVALTNRFLEKFELNIPPLPTQQKIVSKLDAFFSHYNRLKEEKRKAKENYEKILQSAIASLIPQKLPEGWEKIRIKEVIIKTMTKDPKKEPDKKFVYIDISSVNKENFKIEYPKHLTGKEAPSRARRIVNENDIIFSTNRPNLKTISIIPKEYNKQICSTGFCVLRSSDKILPNFLFYLMISDNVLDQINSKMRGIQYPAVSDSDVLNAIITLPPLEEQEKIIKKLDIIYQEKNNISNEQSNIDFQLSQLPKAVLSKAFKGGLM